MTLGTISLSAIARMHPSYPVIAGIMNGTAIIIVGAAWDYFATTRFAEGDVLFHEGDDGDAACVIAKGSAAVTIHVPDGRHRQRPMTFTTGTIVGEMALLNGGVRSADVEALNDLICYRMSRTHFAQLERDAPRLALCILQAISETPSATRRNPDCPKPVTGRQKPAAIIRRRLAERRKLPQPDRIGIEHLLAGHRHFLFTPVR